MTNELLSPDQIADIEQFEAQRKRLEEIVSQARKVPTPREHLKKKGEFDTVNFDYMNQQMDHFHPQRSVKIIKSEFNPDTLTYFFAVEVTDLQTHERRAGTAVHPIIAYEANSEVYKSKKKIREAMSNAAKAALTESLRDAYAHFGIAADMYGMDFKTPVTEDQQQRFEEIIQAFGKIDYPLEIKSQAITWIESTKKLWNDQYEQTADKFLSVLQDTLTQRKEKYNGSAR